MSRVLFLSSLLLILSVAVVVGEEFELSWSTADAGGGSSSGGAFSLSGTAGQPDAQIAPVMTGGSFELAGGFWPATAPVCSCPGDMNGDTFRNGLDVQQFVQCVVGGGACNCADIDGVPGVNMGDVGAFVNNILSGTACP